jgi:phage baseplate assembly protein W
MFNNITKKYTYSDFDIKLSLTDNNDIKKNTEQEAIKNSVRNILFTQKGERLFQPEFGSNIKKYIYEQVTLITAQEIRLLIENQLKRYEPRVIRLEVEVYPDAERNLFLINIFYRDRITEERRELSFNLEVGK